MLKDFFGNRPFIGALVFFVLCVGGGMLNMHHAKQKGEADLAATEDHVRQWNEKQKEQPTAETPVVEQPAEGGHFHSDGTFHAEPHEPIAAPSDVSKPEVSTENTPPRMEYNAGAGNPHPWEHVPVDLRDFEATKAAMIANINFFKANWDPKVYNREVSIADAISHNIANAARATDLGLYTPEQALELERLRQSLLEFKDPGGHPGRTRELREQGYTRKEAIRIAAEETLQRWGVK